MNTQNNTQTKTQSNTANQIQPWQLEAYRAVMAMDIDDTAVALDSFLAHRDLFEAAGETALAAGAQRAWWADAMLLAAEAVTSKEAAQHKLEALQPAFDGRGWAMTDHELRSVRAMIAAAVAVEHGRCGGASPAEAPAFDEDVMQRMRREIREMEQNMNIINVAIAPMAAWQADLYGSLTTPATMVKAITSTTRFADHRATLQASGEAAAVAGATTHLRSTLLKLAAVTALSPQSLNRKVSVLAAYRAVWADQALAVAMIEAAVTADAAALAMEPAGQAQLLRALRGQS